MGVFRQKLWKLWGFEVFSFLKNGAPPVRGPQVCEKYQTSTPHNTKRFQYLLVISTVLESHAGHLSEKKKYFRENMI